jgi:hypothetical protein
MLHFHDVSPNRQHSMELRFVLGEIQVQPQTLKLDHLGSIALDHENQIAILFVTSFQKKVLDDFHRLALASKTTIEEICEDA